MGRRRARPLALALRGVLDRGGPRTSLARVQAVWREAVGDGIASQAEPVSERAGTVTIACGSATWSQELSLMHDDLLLRLNERLEGAGEEPVSGLRFAADRARHSGPAQGLEH
jgi:predicted nucleic acid-binding Zn ribbon protein